MKIIAGIDPHHSSENLIHMVGRMRFPGAEAICACFMPMPVSPTPALSGWPDVLTREVIDADRHTACRVLERAQEEFEAFAIPVSQVFEVGDAYHHLADLAEYRDADMIAIGSRASSATLSFMLGSVGRALTLHSKHTLLLVKGEVSPIGTLRAVFAYDASPFCDASIDELLRLQPEGLTHIDLLIVDTAEAPTSPVTKLLGEETFGEGRSRRHEILLNYAEAAANRLRVGGYGVRTICYSGRVDEVIRGEVIDTKADLVIVGAQGHGWIERALFGSVALGQAVSEPHSVLILRPRIFPHS